MCKRCLSTLLFILITLVLFVTNTFASGWSIETVDPTVGYYNFEDTSIALDSAGKAHISYHDSTDGDLKYTTNNSGSWVTSTVDRGSHASIALDSSDKAHISYTKNDGLMYATNASGSWVTTTVDSGGVDGYNTSLALDTSGKAHISYSKKGIGYATNVSGEWVTTTVDSSGGFNSIVLDISGKAHISYYDYTNDDLKYATNASGTWVTTTVDSDGEVGRYCSLALDTSGKVHISYFDDTNNALKYATNASGSWVTTTVDSSSSHVGEYTSIALDSSDKAHISYYDYHNNYLKYATNASGSWAYETVDGQRMWAVGRYTSIAVDSSGNVSISYCDETFGLLKYAFSHWVMGGTWTKENVDAPPNLANFYSRAIAVDVNGNPHITYGGDHLYYAFYDGSSWYEETVDLLSGVGQYASIALDKSGNAHISYYDKTNKDLKYATNASGSWTTTTVDSNGDVGAYTCIALNRSGKAHISYYDETNGNLKYAYKVAGSWKTKTVDDSGEVRGDTSIAIDRRGKAHISYIILSAYEYGYYYYLNYATNASGSWKTKTIDDAGDTRSHYTSVAVDKSGKVHISYYTTMSAYDSGSIMYATNASGSWETKYVDGIGYVSGGSSVFSGAFTSSIAVDKSGVAHICYYDYDDRYLKYATNKSGSWVSETTEVEGTYKYISLSLDTSGKAHISYYDGYYNKLKYATNTTGSWETMVVKRSGEKTNTHIAVDRSGKTHICYIDRYTKDRNDKGERQIKYATNASGSWITETVCSTSGYVINDVSMSLDISGGAHICYFNGRDLNIEYFTNISGSWVNEVIEHYYYYDEVERLFTSIALDRSNKMHIAYASYYEESYSVGCGYCGGSLYYTTNVSGSWITEGVDQNTGVGNSPAIALDESGKVHISYYDSTNGYLKYATNATGSWATETVDSNEDIGSSFPVTSYSSSIALDESGKAHISYYYYDSTNGYLKYATNASGSWVTETLDSGRYGDGDVDSYIFVDDYSSSIVLDSSGKAHIGYYDIINEDLKYATNAAGSWVKGVLDRDDDFYDGYDGEVGLYPSIALDTAGKVHISYADESGYGQDSALKCITNATQSTTDTN